MEWDGYIDKKCKKNLVALEPTIWAELPLEIQLNLLYYLPIRALCRFRVVSKSWCERYSRVMEQRNAQKSYVIVACDKAPVIYSKAEQAWLQSSWNYDSRTSFIVSSKGTLTCVSAVKGLWVTVMSQGHSIHLPNRPSCHHLLFAGMDILDDSSYVIVFIEAWVSEGVGEIVREVQVYHSVTGRWATKSLELPKEEYMMCGTSETGSKCAAALRGSTLFFLAEPDFIDATLYSMDVLSEVSTSPSQLCRLYGLRDCDEPRLVICAGKLLLVHLQNVNGELRRTITIEEFKEKDKEWSCVSTLPLHLLPEKSEDIVDIGHVSSGNAGDVCISFDERIPSYAYDMFADKWEMLSGGLDVYAAYPFEL